MSEVVCDLCNKELGYDETRLLLCPRPSDPYELCCTLVACRSCFGEGYTIEEFLDMCEQIQAGSLRMNGHPILFEPMIHLPQKPKVIDEVALAKDRAANKPESYKVERREILRQCMDGGVYCVGYLYENTSDLTDIGLYLAVVDLMAEGVIVGPHPYREDIETHTDMVFRKNPRKNPDFFGDEGADRIGEGVDEINQRRTAGR